MRRRSQTPLHRELEEVRALCDWVRQQIYAVPEGGRRAQVTTAIAAAAAEEAYRLSDLLPQYTNDTSAAWREHLESVWAFLGGDASQHYAMSAAIAGFLTSPLNHNEGQDGPGDFDRPQTIASYSATLSAVAWGVDFAITAIMQIFELLDLKFDGEFPPERRALVAEEVRRVKGWVDLARDHRSTGAGGFRSGTLAALRQVTR